MARPKCLEPMINFTARIPVRLRDELLAACAQNDVHGTQIVRAAMRDYVAAQRAKTRMTAEPVVSVA